MRTMTKEYLESTKDMEYASAEIGGKQVYRQERQLPGVQPEGGTIGPEVAQ